MNRVIPCAFWLLIGSTLAQAQYTATCVQPLWASGSSFSSTTGANQVGSAVAGDNWHPALWSGTRQSAIDLQPAGYVWGRAEAANGDRQVGYAWSDELVSRPHAFLWHGTAASATDLTPANYYDSFAYGISADSEVGRATSSSSGWGHALLWHDSPEAIDLNPSNFTTSEAFTVWGQTQGGEGTLTGSGPSRALLWNGTAASAIDLHPSGYTSSRVDSIWGDTEVGFGDTHALVWHGTAASAHDINPAGYDSSWATRVHNGAILGMAASNNQDHAMIWSNEWAAPLDLHQYLSGLTLDGTPLNLRESWATDIDDNGNIVGYAYSATGTYAVTWTPVPEPSTIVALLVGLGATVPLRRRTVGPRNSFRIQAAKPPRQGDRSRS